MAEEPRGRSAVEDALVQAAAELLAERGPRGAGVRDIARRAGVNHGQVHHYFGGKDPLVRAAMRQLAAEHLAHATARSGGAAVPPPLSLAEDTEYWRAVIRTVLDGDLAIARVELDEGLSVPHRALLALTEQRGLDEPDTELKARVATSVALQLAWAVLEEFVFAVTDVAPDEREAVRAHVARVAATGTAQPRTVARG